MKKIIITITSIIFIIILVNLLFNNSSVVNQTKPEVNKFTIEPKTISHIQNMPLEIKVYISKQNKIVDLKLEDYVAGVVAAEMPADFQVEALKAQAIASRTYAVAHINDKCTAAKGADLCDTTHSQVYISKEDAIKSWEADKGEAYWNKIIQAVNSTKGEVLNYQGEMVTAPLYFSTSSGRTESSLDVFNEDEPYLKSVESPGEETSPEYKSIKTMTYNQLTEKINSSYPKAGVTLTKVKNQVKIINSFQGGSVKSIKLGSLTISGVAFRNLLNLDSSNFKLDFGSKDVQITSKGYGHDVGMSQWGANVMAKNGVKYKDILYHYYVGTKVEIMKQGS